MLRALLRALRQDRLMVQALDRTDEALEKAEQLTRESLGSLLDSRPPEIDVYAVDREINQAEIDIRRLIFEHLTVNPREDLTPALVLATTIDDVERIGDYAKNLYEQAHRYHERFGTGEPWDELRSIADEVLAMFGEAAHSFREGEEEEAEAIMRKHSGLGRRCEALIDGIMAGSHQLAAREAVHVSLTARFLKRISGHLSNLVSSVVNPYDRIGYRPKVDPPEDAD